MNTVLIYSGGLDSTVLLYQLLQAQHRVYALTIHYGQRHACEIDSARAICAENGVEHRVLELPQLACLFGGGSLTDFSTPVPEGHYEEASMKATVVPNRNMILLSLAAAWAMSLKADSISYAAHAGDHAIYPDCRPAFADAMDHAIALADWHPVRLDRPFVGKPKTELVRLGASLGVPFAKTWSCYQGKSKHCGCCGTCIERRQAFYEAGIDDPTPYAAEAPSLETLISHDWKLNS